LLVLKGKCTYIEPPKTEEGNFSWKFKEQARNKKKEINSCVRFRLVPVKEREYVKVEH
jgi:hypothetical protein